MNLQTLLCGKQVAAKIYENLQLVPQPDEKSQYGLDVILVGERSDSKLYVSMKSKKLAEYGIHVNVHHFESDVEEKELIETIKSLNRSRTTLGIMIQLPLPEHLNTQTICDTIDPKKDVDGLTSFNIGGIVTDTSIFKPCTAEAVMQILDYYEIPIEGKEVTVLGKSNVIGTPVSLLLSKKNATVTMCDIYTPDAKEFTRRSDIIVTATGKAELINVTWFSKKSCVVIDVGISVKEVDGKKRIYGDVKKSLESTIWRKTPVPGGVGPVTISVLVSHCLEAYKKIFIEKKEREYASLNIPTEQLMNSLHQFC